MGFFSSLPFLLGSGNNGLAMTTCNSSSRRKGIGPVKDDNRTI
jgi:hypothetical protein